MIKRKKEYDKWNKKRQQWSEEGKCRGCGRERLKKNKSCLQCYLIDISHNALGTGKYWKDLIKLMEKQKFTCVLTGDKLTWDSKIELDHIIPISRGGKKELVNVRWITEEANQIKQNFTDKELKDLCAKILKNIE